MLYALTSESEYQAAMNRLEFLTCHEPEKLDEIIALGNAAYDYENSNGHSPQPPSAAGFHPLLDKWLSERGFTNSHELAGKKSITALFKNTKVCGVYFLHFANDEYYVGLAKNVARRYLQHRKTHSDIVKISFKPVSSAQLKIVESADIEFFKNRVRLRNIDEMEDLIMERKFDKLISPDFAEAFLNNMDYNDLSGEKYHNEPLQSKYKYRRSHQALSQCSFYNDLLTISRIYLQHCVPAPQKTEYAFWSISCFDIKKNSPILRLNIYLQEVFTVYYLGIQNGEAELEFVFHLARSPLLEDDGSNSAKVIIRRQCPSAEFSKEFYPTGSKDQMRLSILGYDTPNLFTQPSFIKATRLHNLRLMRKGTSMNKVSHCMDLAEQMLVSYDNSL